VRAEGSSARRATVRMGFMSNMGEFLLGLS
jgi:hypothetical protein